MKSNARRAAAAAGRKRSAGGSITYPVGSTRDNGNCSAADKIPSASYVVLAKHCECVSHRSRHCRRRRRYDSTTCLSYTVVAWLLFLLFFSRPVNISVAAKIIRFRCSPIASDRRLLCPVYVRFTQSFPSLSSDDRQEPCPSPRCTSSESAWPR